MPHPPWAMRFGRGLPQGLSQISIVNIKKSIVPRCVVLLAATDAARQPGKDRDRDRAECCRSGAQLKLKKHNGKQTQLTPKAEAPKGLAAGAPNAWVGAAPNVGCECMQTKA